MFFQKIVNANDVFSVILRAEVSFDLVHPCFDVVRLSVER